MGIRSVRLAGLRGLPRALAFLVAAGLLAIALAGASTAGAVARCAAGPGDLLWSMRLGSGDTDALHDAAPTFDGGVAAVGLTNKSFPGLYGDGLVVKYNVTGTQLWAMAYDDGDNRYDEFARVEVAPDGGVVAAGRHETVAGDADLLVVKYDASGARLWAASVDAGVGKDGLLGDMAVDPNGDVVVAGTAHAFGDDRLLVARLDGKTGVVEWSFATYGPGTSDAKALSCAVAAGGAAYVTGTTRKAGFLRLLVLRVEASSAVTWARTWGSKSMTVVGRSVRLDTKGRPFVVAQVEDATGLDVALLRYTAAGARVLLRRYGFAGGRHSVPADMAIDIEGRVFICGQSDSATGPAVAGFILSYSGSGSRRYARLYPRTAPRDTSFAAVLPDRAGGAYVCGGVGEPQAYRHRLMVHYSASGGRVWSRSVTNTATAGNDDDSALAPCGNEVVTAVGWYRYSADDYDGIADAYRR